MTYYEAAVEVLRSAGRPLTMREITEQAIKRRLIAPSGKTPLRTMAAMMYRRLEDGAELVKIDSRDDQRAKRGTVRWTLRGI